jgi:hypothetical protein
VRADVLPVAVQIEDRAFRLAARRQEPGEELGAVGGVQLDRLVLEAVQAGSLVERTVGLEEDRRTAATEKREQHGGDGAHVRNRREARAAPS